MGKEKDKVKGKDEKCEAEEKKKRELCDAQVIDMEELMN